MRRIRGTPVLRLSELERMCEEDPVNRAGEINNRRRWTREAQWALSQSGKNTLECQSIRARNARVMTPESMQLMRVGSGDQQFAKLGGHFRRAPIWVEQSFMKVTELDRVKTIDLVEKTFADRTTKHVKRMRRDGEDRQSTAGTKLTNVVKIS